MKTTKQKKLRNLKKFRTSRLHASFPWMKLLAIGVKQIREFHRKNHQMFLKGLSLL